jgi:hypothetical protein
VAPNPRAAAHPVMVVGVCWRNMVFVTREPCRCLAVRTLVLLKLARFAPT